MNTFINFTYLPVQLISLSGIVCSLLSLIYSVYVLVKWLTFGVELAGWTTIVMLVSTLGGLILLALSIIAAYLWRILDECRRRPEVVIEEIIRPSVPSNLSKTHQETKVYETI